MAEFESPLSIPAQDPIISWPIGPILTIPYDSHCDSSDSENDIDLIQPIVHDLESEPLIFKNAQFEGAVEPSQLPDPLDLPSHLAEDLSPNSPFYHILVELIAYSDVGGPPCILTLKMLRNCSLNVKINFLRYEPSCQCRSMRDSSVSYASVAAKSEQQN
ncbi:hypothetical protein QJS10_CPA09g01104 [Acorus calamus]|uniref:Uncharacterized protein n=1 Tax=Acorus calamus TaxID=4465 RepID=A0AAV9E376_ACOCL|nr:hypothetical protein QJS10_CPA09g01104 [Acorus calamus]